MAFKDLAVAIGKGKKTVQRTVGSLVDRGLIDYQSAVGQGKHGWIRVLTTGSPSDAPQMHYAQPSTPQADASPHPRQGSDPIVAGHPAAEPCPPTRQATELASDLPGGHPPTDWCPVKDTTSTWVDTRDPVDAHPPVEPLAHVDPGSPLQPTTANEAGQEENVPDGARREPASSDPEREYLVQLIQPLGNHMGESMNFDRFITEKLGEVAATLRARGYTPQEAFQHASARGDLHKAQKPLNLLAYRLRQVLDDPNRRSHHETAAAAAAADRQRAEREAEHQAHKEAERDGEERIAAAEFAAWRADHPEFIAVEALPIEEQLTLIGPSATFLNRENGFPQDVRFAEKALANHQARNRADTTKHSQPSR